MSLLIHSVSSAEVLRMVHGTALYVVSVWFGLFAAKRFRRDTVLAISIGVLLIICGLILAHMTYAIPRPPYAFDQILRTASPFASIMGTTMIIGFLMERNTVRKVGVKYIDIKSWPPPPSA